MATMSQPVASYMYVFVALDRRAKPGVSTCRKRGFLLLSCLLPSIPRAAARKGKMQLSFATKLKIDLLRWAQVGLRVEQSFRLCFFASAQRQSQKFLTSSWQCVAQPGRVREPTADRGRWSPQRCAGIQRTGRSWRKKKISSLSGTILS